MCSHETMREAIAELRRQRDEAERERETAEANEAAAMEEVGNLQDAVIRLEAERDFLARCFTSADGRGEVDTGLSSKALIAWTLRRCKWRDVRRPRDLGDLARCEGVFEAAPDHMKKRMSKGLERFRKAPGC